MKIEFNLEPLKRQVEQNPLVAAGIAAAVLNGAAKLINANTSRTNAKSWSREVARRDRLTK